MYNNNLKSTRLLQQISFLCRPLAINTQRKIIKQIHLLIFRMEVQMDSVVKRRSSLSTKLPQCKLRLSHWTGETIDKRYIRSHPGQLSLAIPPWVQQVRGSHSHIAGCPTTWLPTPVCIDQYRPVLSKLLERMVVRQLMMEYIIIFSRFLFKKRCQMQSINM